jgi:2,6-dihydroxypyridine 3-monooxygenase
VKVTLATGRRAEADLLICADGVSSPSRARLQPAARRSYSGYVAWRGTVPESEVSPATSGRLGDALTYQVLPASHILAYPIPGPDGPGERLINLVWYVNVPAGAELDDLMTGRDGILRSVSLPPGAATDRALAEELTAADGNIPAALTAWERRQLALGHDLLARCRAIGDSSQFHGTFRPGDPRLIFGLYAPGN